MFVYLKNYIQRLTTLCDQNGHPSC